MSHRWLKRKVLSVIVASMACALIATSASAAAPPASDEELVAFQVEVEVIDYTADGDVISVHTETYDLDDATQAPTIQVTAPAGDLQISATTSSGVVQPQSSKGIGYPPAKTNTGCRSISLTAVGSTAVGTLYKITNKTYYCWKKSTYRVTSASPDWWVAYQSGLVDVSLLSSNIAYYNNGHGSHSAHKNNVQWKVCSGGAGLCGWYYPRVNITVRGDGSASASANSGV